MGKEIDSTVQRVLVVEDDEGIRSFVKLELEHESFEVNTAATGREALASFEKDEPDIILLDIMLPELSGLEVLRRIRKTSAVPVIMLTALGETYDKVNGLNAGADDYLTKPFEIEELLARMRALLRRSSGPLKEMGTGVIHFKDLTLTPNTMEVTVGTEHVELSKTEYMLLKYFLDNRNKVLGRDEIISAVWGKEHYIEDNAVDVYVGYIRAKIDRTAGDTYISTVRGAGYIMRDESK